MIKKPAELILIRNDFYWRSYVKIKGMVSILLIICFALIIFTYYQSRSVIYAPRYIPTTPDGVLIISPPLPENHLLLSQQRIDPNGYIYGMPEPKIPYNELEPAGENALVLYWAKMVIESMFDYDYVHYRRVIEHSRMYFTAQGHENFIQALLNSKNLETVKARSAIVVPEVTGPVKLISTGMVYGRFAWELEVPLRLTYESAANPLPIVQNLLAKLSIARVTTLTNPFYGLAIYQLNFQEKFEQGTT